MNQIVFDLLPVFFLIGLGAWLGRTGFFRGEMIEGLKRIVANIALPALLFVAFSRVQVDLRLMALAGSIFLACGVMGWVGRGVARRMGLPLPASAFLSQGFEAGMLGYALFSAAYGRASLHHFAAADLGQVVYVFTVLMLQLWRAEADKLSRSQGIAAAMLSSPVMLAIAGGLLAAAAFPDASDSPWGEHGALMPLLSSLGAMTTPLVCLVVGFSLKDFRVAGLRQPLIFVVTRMAMAGCAGASIALLLQQVHPIEKLQVDAIMILFLLPPPFVIPVFRSAGNDSEFIGNVLSLHTLLSILAILLVVSVGN